MKYAALLSILILAGCTTAPQVVQVPIPVPCKVDVPQAPVYRFSPPYKSVFEAVRDLLGDRGLALAYENSLTTALKVCK